MSQPDAYNRFYNFANFQAANPASPIPAGPLDIEFSRIKAVLDQIRTSIAFMQRDDFAIGNDTIGLDQLKPEVSVGLNPPTVWATATNYVIRDTVFNGLKMYSCAVSHVSGVFATDLAAVKWTLLADFTAAQSAALVSYSNATSNLAAVDVQAAIDEVVTHHVAKAAGSYTAVAADNNQFWRATGAVTINLTAAATLKNGWRLWVRANGGAVTIDPAGAETIDGAATLVIPDGAQCLVICTGAAFVTLFSTGAITGTGSFSALTFSGLLTSPYSFKQDGRLTLTTAVPVTTADVTAAATLYYTPYTGNVISLYDGTKWVNRVFSEISLSLTGILTSGKPHDIFIYDNAGTAAFDRQAWTNDTTRGSALVRQDGILVQSGALTRRYVGTIYATSTGTTEDSKAKRFLWNMYNRVRRHMSVYDATDSWTYTTATIRQANAAVTNQLDFVRGLDEDSAEASIAASFSNSAANVIVSGGIGLDATNALAADSDAAYQATAAIGTVQQMRATYRGNPGLGRHFLAWLEYSTASGTTTWYGDNNVVTIARSGIQGSVLA